LCFFGPAKAFRLCYLLHAKPNDQRDPMSHSFSVILEPQQKGGFTVLVPALPEVVTEGDTEQEALANAEEAIRAVLDYRRAHGLKIPDDAAPKIRRVTIAA
jgi:antitoxin HicB